MDEDDHPRVTRVDLLDGTCRVDLSFPDPAQARRFARDLSALLDQTVDLDVLPAVGSPPLGHPRRPAGNGGNGAHGGHGGPSSPSEIEVLSRGVRHDLQSPLTALRSYLELVLDHGDGTLPEGARDHLEEAAAGAERLQSMVDGIGVFGRDAHVDGPREPVDLDEALDDALANLGDRLDGGEVVLEREPLPTLRGDPGSLTRVLQNLLANALDHGGRPLTIRVSAEEEPRGWRVRVADDGPGLPEHLEAGIFSPLESGSRANGAGGGVGLAVCRRIVEAHGGSIGVDSGEDGAAFWFSLPVAALRTP